MTKRPIESKFGIGTGILSGYTALKVRKLGSDFNRNINNLQKNLNHQNEQLLSGQNKLIDMHIASMSGIYNIHLEVQELSKSQWALVQHFENLQAEKERLGDLKLFLRNVKKEVGRIRTISQTHPVYATFMAENLVKMFDAQNVRIEHFKMLTVDEIDWADEVIESVGNLFNYLQKNLE